MQKDKLFETYTNPKYVLTAFENEADGLEFLRHILSAIHPNLRQLTDYDKMPKPKFQQCHDIHDFIAKYNEWLREEKLSNNREYTDKETMDYILSELDDRFETARSKMETKRNELYADPLNPKPFPPQYRAGPKLSINIMDLIPHSERNNTDFSNQTATINRMNTRNSRRDTSSPRKDPYRERKKEHWSETIKWKYLPGAVCSACGQNNHDIYETGCPAMAVFCNCQKFFNKSKPEHLRPVIEQFAKFKKEQREK